MCKQFVHLSRYLAGQFCEKGWPRALWARRMKRESCLGDNNFFTQKLGVSDGPFVLLAMRPDIFLKPNISKNVT